MNMSPSKFKIVLIDDNKDFLDATVPGLTNFFVVNAFSDPVLGLNYVQCNTVDGVILDLNIPGISGFELYIEIKKEKPLLPIFFLTGELDLDLRINGLDLGADDFLLKPINMLELIARVKNRLTKWKREPPPKKVFQLKNLSIETDTLVVRVDEGIVILTPKEFQILIFLINNQNKIVSRDEVMTHVWSDVFVGINNLDTHFYNLRKKLKGFSQNIKTKKGLGYILKI